MLLSFVTHSTDIISVSDTPDYHLEVRGLADSAGSNHVAPPGALKGRPWVGIRFECCGAYTRVYRNAEGTAYHGFCPRCGRTVTLRVGEGGTSARFFVAE